MTLRDKTIDVGDGEVVFSSPPRGISWHRGRYGRFSMNINRVVFTGQVLLTASSARKVAAELVRRAEDIERRD